MSAHADLLAAILKDTAVNKPLVLNEVGWTLFLRYWTVVAETIVLPADPTCYGDVLPLGGERAEPPGAEATAKRHALPPRAAQPLRDAHQPRD